MTECAVCGARAKARGLCNRHYLRLRRHGSPKAGGPDRRSFTQQIVRTDHGWEWTGVTNTIRGLTYGRYAHQYVHRMAYEFWVGPIPPGDFVVDHQPGCPKVCVTPGHLTLFTRGDHTRVGWQRGEITGDQIRAGHERKVVHA